ncbi:response regulator [Acetanaerobacterium elongatum]|uniref:Stage 0 sporulation protein A homolog n=1 Tax=Acetanaerobacterium elongatum TaxID=258515 RepID=A0A1G9ZEY4_9FIRM|nr:response regulator [Acetanaerobacterium elongatum]SDN19898.1 two-component system, chemotaxis family, response regulator CheY [Acetanaerobacterium elongatum]
MGKKILVVDDAAFMRLMIKDVLSKNGYAEIEEAGDGELAVAAYQAGHHDLVILDITMPNMDGLEALKRIKGIDASSRVVMCSAMGQESMVVDAIKLGALDFIVKPFKPDRIIQTVKNILG